MEHISWTDFEKSELRAGTVVEVKEFPEARKPALTPTISPLPGLPFFLIPRSTNNKS